MNENTKLRYSLIIDMPELGSQDTFNIDVDLKTHPEVIGIIYNFYRFLLRIGIEEEIIDQYILLDDFSDEDDEEIEKDLSDINISLPDFSILKNSKDISQKEKFLEKLNKDDKFLEEVFQLFLTSFIEVNENEI